MERAVIVSAVRTGVGNYGGQWSPIEPYKLAGQVIKEAVARSGVDPNEIEDVIMGNLYGQHGNIARVAALEAGIPCTAGAVTVDRQCGSSLHTIYEAAMNIMLGNGHVFVACGLEHMTREPWQLEKTTTPFQRTGPSCMPTKVTTDETGMDRMGMTAERIATQYGLSRQELDAFALDSHQKAARAVERGAFKEQILPIELKGKKGATYIVDTDEALRPLLTMEQLGKLKPAFNAHGIVTAGNSCPWSDGASAVVLMSESRAKEMGIEPLGVVVSFAVSGLDPFLMGLGPIYAVPKALKRAGIEVKDLDVVELNEAFAAQAIPCMRELGLTAEQVNPNGGGIALGHPLGATGALLTTKALYDMRDRDLTYGLITMCIGGGQGSAMVIKRER
ncbi:thiolase family protein [Lachnospiraceae bacterium OttesenSCG-928-D06]|nr:thiolase family protein [Lachnospiraceae bacterium OttesenSCG-928-D06]